MLLSASLGQAAEEGTLVQVPDLRVVGWTLDDTDPLGGNGDGGLQPGETALLVVYLANAGNEPAQGVTGQLFEATGHPDVELLDKLALWPNLPATGAPAASLAPHFEVRVAATRPCRWEIPLRLELTADGGYSSTQEFVLELVDPLRIDLASGMGRPFVFGRDTSDSLGRSIATGDLDGDGFDDIVVGAPSGDGPGNARANGGEVMVIYGAASRPADLDLASPPAGLTFIHGAEAGDNLGTEVTTGDLNADGYDDLVLAAGGADGPANARSAAGEIAVVYGSPTRTSVIDLVSPPAGVVLIYGAEANDNLGSAVATGDVNGDGFDDLVLAASFADGPGNARGGAGEAVVIPGRGTPLSTLDLAALPSDTAIIYAADAGDQFGGSAATGDVDGDGFDDIVLGAIFADGPGNLRSWAGEVAVIYGRPGPVPDVDLASPPFNGVTVIYGEDLSDLVGDTTRTGDLDGDGLADLLLGATSGDGPANARASAGELRVIYGSAARPSSVDLASPPPGIALIHGAEADDALGWGITAGDLDGDGFDDLVVAAPNADGPANARADGGEAAVLHGGPSRLSEVDLAFRHPAIEMIYGADALDQVALAAATGDVDGDGIADLIVGAGGGDGPTDARSAAGEIAVIAGAPRSRYRHDPETFAFIDATIGTSLGLACDDCGATIAIGFEFDFFGRKVTEVTVSSNGYLTFGGPADRLPAFCPPRSGAPNNVIAVFWDDLDPSSGGAVFSLLQGAAPNRRLTVEWANVPLYGGIGSGTFEVTLFEASDRIVMQHQDTTFGSGSHDTGGAAIVAVENATGLNGAEYSCFYPSVYSSTARAWRRFASPTLVFADDVESGVGGFTATGLWHRESGSACAPASRSGSFSWYYGQTGSCNYNTGVTNAGTLTTQLIAGLPQDARASFWQRRQTEGEGFSFDVCRLEVQANAGPFVQREQMPDWSNTWRFSEDLLPPRPEGNVFSSVDLSGYAGQDVRVRFSFDTVDATGNTYLGWMVDDVAIHACPVFGSGMAAAAAEARATAQPEVICEDASTQLDAVGSYCAACAVPLTYQWAEEGAPIGGATGVTHTLLAGHAPGTFDFTVAVACPANPSCAAASDPVEVAVVANPDPVGPTLMVTTNGSSLTFHWSDVAGASDYVVLSGTVASVPPATEVGATSSGTAGLTAPIPPGKIVFFKVAGRNPTCGVGPS